MAKLVYSYNSILINPTLRGNIIDIFKRPALLVIQPLLAVIKALMANMSVKNRNKIWKIIAFH